jgi:hypothetical protein
VPKEFMPFHPSRKFSDPLLAAPARTNDGTLPEDSPLKRWGALMREAMNASGRVAATEELLRERLEKADCVDVQAFTLHIPIGPWAKDKYEPWSTLGSRGPGAEPLSGLNCQDLGLHSLAICEPRSNNSPRKPSPALWRYPSNSP